MTDAPWRIAAASAIGTSHAGTGDPCQDCFVVELLEGAAEPALAVVVSDGAGSAPRSDLGSALACRTLLREMREYLARGGTVAHVARETAEGWMIQAAGAIDEVALQEERPAREFACTLLAALVAPEAAVFLQIGDGAMVVRSGDAPAWQHVFWPQHGDYINTTHFITDADSLSRFAFEQRSGAILELAAFSDGIEALVLHYATRTVHAPFFDAMFPAVRALADDGVSEPLSAQLTAYLASPPVCARTDDDKTLVLASRVTPGAEG